jgi:hypothetical protein
MFLLWTSFVAFTEKRQFVITSEYPDATVSMNDPFGTLSTNWVYLSSESYGFSYRRKAVAASLSVEMCLHLAMMHFKTAIKFKIRMQNLLWSLRRRKSEPTPKLHLHASDALINAALVYIRHRHKKRTKRAVIESPEVLRLIPNEQTLIHIRIGRVRSLAIDRCNPKPFQNEVK